LLDMLFRNWLLIGPHPDDVELGCGATVAQYGQTGKTYLVVSPATDDPRNRNILAELELSRVELGLTEKPMVWNFTRRRLHESRYDLRQAIYRLVVEELKPDLIFVPSLNDLHPDHQLITEEVARMFRDRTILGYETPVTHDRANTKLYVRLKSESVERKIRALMCYASQRHRQYFNADVVQSVMRACGAQVNTKYAEAFEIIRMVI
jgi:LmbE family N-acetylglucosaminyl deacetylase